MIELVCTPENQSYINLAVVVIYIAVETWLGENRKTKSGSLLGLIKNIVVKLITRKK